MASKKKFIARLEAHAHFSAAGAPAFFRRRILSIPEGWHGRPINGDAEMARIESIPWSSTNAILAENVVAIIQCRAAHTFRLYIAGLRGSDA